MNRIIEPEPIIELQTSEHGTYTIFDLPGSVLPAAERLVNGLKERAFMVRLLQGDERPDGMTSPYGIWPHPDEKTLEFMTQETALPIKRDGVVVAGIGEAALRAA